MSKHNYSQYSNKNRENKPKVKEQVPEVKMEYKEPEEVVLMGPIEATPETYTPAVDVIIKPATLPKTVAGVVANCAKLNVRSKPSITGEVMCVLNASSEIEIDVEKSVSDWVYVCTATGVEGYCMRQFIKADL